MLLKTLASSIFCSGLAVHFICVGTDTSLHCLISCNSKPFAKGLQVLNGMLNLSIMSGFSSLVLPSSMHAMRSTRRMLQRTSFLLRLAEPQELCLLGSHKCDLFCLTSPSVNCNRSGRFSYFKKVSSVEQTSRDKGLKWCCLFYFLINFSYKCYLTLLLVVTGGQAALASLKGYIYSPSVASKGSRKVVSTF